MKELEERVRALIEREKASKMKAKDLEGKFTHSEVVCSKVCEEGG